MVRSALVKKSVAAGLYVPSAVQVYCTKPSSSTWLLA